MVVRDLIDEAFVGNKHTQRFTITDEDGSVPLDLTTLQIKWGMVPVNSAGQFATTPLTLEKNNFGIGGVVIVDGPNGIVDVEIDESDTANLTPTTYYFELEVQTSLGTDPVVVATGTLTLIPNLVNM